MATEVEMNRFPELSAKLILAMDAIVRKAALDVQAYAQREVRVDTGFCKSSIYTVTENDSTYGQGVITPKKDQTLLPEESRPEPHQALVCVGASYGAPLEFGGEGRQAYPYLTPAAEAVRPTFEMAMSRIEDRMRGL